MRNKFSAFWAVFFLLTLYTGSKAALLLPVHPALAWLLTYGFFALIVGWQFAYRAGKPSPESPWFDILAWSASIGMGVWATFLFLSLALDAGSEVFILLLKGTPPGWLSWGVFAAALGVALLGLRQVLKGPELRKVDVPIAGLPAALEGLTIAQLTDLHVGPTIRSGYAGRIVDLIMAQKPDLIAVTGDLADGSPEDLAAHVRSLARLKAPLGVYYVTGNHEYYWGVEKWIEKARELGMIPLVNENRVVERGGAKILIAGLPDGSGGHFLASHRGDPKRAAGSSQEAAVRVLLAHRPDACLEAEPLGFSLQLSGHTHAGQFFPWSLLIPFFHRYHRGLNRHGRLWVYVCAGAGYWGPPHRFLVPAEIALLRLTRAA